MFLHNSVIPPSSKRAVKIYLSRPGQFMDLSGRMGYKIFPGDVIQTQVTYQDVRMMEKDGPDGGKSCSREVFDECLYGAITERMYREVGCTVPWVINNSR